MKNKMPLRRHRDDDYWDHVTIDAEGAHFTAFIRPRWKMSGLSGDEWRISANIEVRKRHEGEVIVKDRFHRMSTVFQHAPYFVYDKALDLFWAHPVATLTVKRKGVLLFEETRPSFADALIGLGWHVVTANEQGRSGYHHLTDEEERKRCQQVGCAEAPVVAYRFKKLQVSPHERTMIEPEYDFVGQYTWYCHEHKKRGDAGLEDCDRNLEEVPLHEELVQ